MTTVQEVLLFVELARRSASQDLHISNELLNIAAEIAKKAEHGPLTPEVATTFAQEIANNAVKLTEQSKKITASIARLAEAS